MMRLRPLSRVHKHPKLVPEESRSQGNQSGICAHEHTLSLTLGGDRWYDDMRRLAEMAAKEPKATLETQQSTPRDDYVNSRK